MAEATREVAKRKYAAKVCGYLGLDPAKCERMFDKLYANMRRAFEAL